MPVSRSPRPQPLQPQPLPTLLDVLQLPINTAWQIGAGLNLPDSPLIPAKFTSLLKVAGDSLQVAILPLTVLNLAIYGQLQKAPDTINKTINAAVTSLMNFPASVAGILNYDASVLHQFFNPVPAPAASVTDALAKSTTESVQKKSPTDGATALKSGDTTGAEDVSDEHADDNGKKDATGEKPSTGKSTDDSTTNPSGTTPSGTTGSTGGTTGSTGTTGSASGSTGKDGTTGSGTTGTHSGTTGGDASGTKGSTGTGGDTGKGGSTGSGGSTVRVAAPTTTRSPVTTARSRTAATVVAPPAAATPRAAREVTIQNRTSRPSNRSI